MEKLRMRTNNQWDITPSKQAKQMRTESAGNMKKTSQVKHISVAHDNNFR
jgi:hypothetical protein